MEVSEIQQKITPILRSHGIKRASIFGSRARGNAREDSDVDLVVQLGKPMGLVAYGRFVGELEKALEREVDVVTEQGLSKHIRQYVEKDLTAIYES